MKPDAGSQVSAAFFALFFCRKPIIIKIMPTSATAMKTRNAESLALSFLRYTTFFDYITKPVKQFSYDF
jgi:hypothetical protein